MSASKNKGRSSSGLRFIWIPGRRKHGHKGHYDTTSKQVNYSGRHKPNQSWSLGGNKGLERLVEPEIPGSSEGASRIIGVLPAVAAGASTTAMKLDDENQFALLGEKEDKEHGNESEFLKSNDIDTEKHTRDDPLGNNNSRENQQQKSERDPNSPEKKNNHHKKSKEDVNSIESLQNKKLKDSSLDITDSSLYLHKYNGKKKNKKKKKKNKDECSNESEDDPDAKIETELVMQETSLKFDISTTLPLL